jgi:hypothetical protein
MNTGSNPRYRRYVGSNTWGQKPEIERRWPKHLLETFTNHIKCILALDGAQVFFDIHADVVLFRYPVQNPGKDLFLRLVGLSSHDRTMTAPKLSGRIYSP